MNRWERFVTKLKLRVKQRKLDIEAEKILLDHNPRLCRSVNCEPCQRYFELQTKNAALELEISKL